jgi:hypothetical protein
MCRFEVDLTHQIAGRAGRGPNRPAGVIARGYPLGPSTLGMSRVPWSHGGGGPVPGEEKEYGNDIEHSQYDQFEDADHG